MGSEICQLQRMAINELRWAGNMAFRECVMAEWGLQRLGSILLQSSLPGVQFS